MARDFTTMSTADLKALQDNYLRTLDDVRPGAVLGGHRTPALGMTPGGQIATVGAYPMLVEALREIAAELRRRGE